MVAQLSESNINLQCIVHPKKYPVYKDLEQLKEYSIENISEIHNSILTIINELYLFYSSKQQTVKDYFQTNNINITITNFINTLEYENTLIREQLYLYVSYIDFFHSTQKRYLEKLSKRMCNFQKDVSENINNYTNTSFIENISNIKDVVKTPPSSPVGSIDTNVCSFENTGVDIPLISQNTNLENIVISTSNINTMTDITHNFGLAGIITVEVSSGLDE